MEISHVIRGEEWLPSAPLHVLLYKAFGWEDSMPQFAHLPLLLKPDGNGKLSKRDGDRLGFPVFPLEFHNQKDGSVSSGYREEGYYPEAVINFLALLGWHATGDQEMYTMQELVEQFSLERVSSRTARSPGSPPGCRGTRATWSTGTGRHTPAPETRRSRTDR